MSVTINKPKTPITEGSHGVATATLPNVCKMPGPPAPFVPTPLPNIARSELKPKGYSKSVKIGGKKVAIRGAGFASTGDIASKGTGGGLVSANTHGRTKFVGPGSMDVKFEGKNVQLLSDPVLNNCGASGAPANSATMLGVLQASGLLIASELQTCPLCFNRKHGAVVETSETKARAGALADALDSRIRAAASAGNSKIRKRKNTTMIGVVQCLCKREYADQSSMVTREFADAAGSLGMQHHPDAAWSYGERTGPKSTLDEQDVLTMRERMRQVIGDDKLLKFLTEESDVYVEESRATGDTAFPLGSCAAQGALVLARLDGAFPTAMTEQWYASDGRSPTGGAITYIDESSGRRTVSARKFAPGETVPPCRTCDLIIPYLMCVEERTCSHEGVST